QRNAEVEPRDRSGAAAARLRHPRIQETQDMFKPLLNRALLALGLSAMAFTSATAQEAYPNKPIKLVVPYAAGGPADLLARMVGERLAPRLGQPVVIENKPGTGGHTGAEQVAKGPADG